MSQPIMCSLRPFEGASVLRPHAQGRFAVTRTSRSPLRLLTRKHLVGCPAATRSRIRRFLHHLVADTGVLATIVVAPATVLDTTSSSTSSFWRTTKYRRPVPSQCGNRSKWDGGESGRSALGELPTVRPAEYRPRSVGTLVLLHLSIANQATVSQDRRTSAANQPDLRHPGSEVDCRQVFALLKPDRRVCFVELELIDRKRDEGRNESAEKRGNNRRHRDAAPTTER